ncbi:MAG: hypothetical protein ACUVSU_10145 [Aggregatilineaceae bacterium]
MPRLLRAGRRPRPDPSAETASVGALPGAGDSEVLRQVSIEPYVPVPSEDAYPARAYSYMAEVSPPPAEAEGVARRRRPRARRAALPTVRWGWLLLALALLAGGIVGTLLRQDRLSADDVSWWPVAVLILAGLWMLVALARRRVEAFLGGAALVGVGLSALLDTQDIASLRETLLGMVLITTGLGIVIRGLVLRGYSPR